MSIGICADRSGQRLCSPVIAAALGLAAFFLAAHATTSYAQTMALPGNFGVSASGAATYNIPIAVPPGTAGLAPSLSLEYNSQGSNGLLGIGWSLGGLPAIGRCPRTLAQDGALGGVNFDANDRFCLDGQRLTAISGTYGADGTEYRTEVESFSRIISHGTAGTGPAWFEVHTKSGQVMEFGHTADSLALAQGKPTARNWALNKVSDTKGNYFTVSYTNDATNGQVYPIEIDYTGNAAASVSPANKVQFVYATRPDITPQYQAGSLSQSTVRLTDIKTFAGSGLIGDYQLAYEQASAANPSRITSVTICDAGGTCLPATTFSWQNDQATGIFTRLDSNIQSDFGAPVSQAYVELTGDFNGDGKTDYLLLWHQYQIVFLSNGDGTFTRRDSNIQSDFGAPVSQAYVPLTGDFNGDGKTDYLLLWHQYQIVFLSNGDGTFTRRDSNIQSDFGAPVSQAYVPLTGDFNGDGKTDYLLLWHNYQIVYLSNGDGTFTRRDSDIQSDFGAPVSQYYDALTGDFNGDGKTDYLLLWHNYQIVFLSNGDGTFSRRDSDIQSDFGAPVSQSYVELTGDFNGDGKTDYLLLWHNYQIVFLSNGDGTFSRRDSNIQSDFGAPVSQAYVPLTGDFNGDGKTDYLLLWHQYQIVFLSNGDGTFTRQDTNIQSDFGAPVSQSYDTLSGDFNGDGKTDLLLLWHQYQIAFRTGGSSNNSLKSITNGLGAATTITYAPLTSSGVYTKDTIATYPVQDFQSPLYVVSQVSTSNGIGGVYSTAYSYMGAKVDLSGRGFLGFRQTGATDLQTNIVETTTYRQDFPYIGLAASTTKALSSLTLNQTTNSYQFSNASGAATLSAPSITIAPYRVSVAQTVNSSFDLDGSAVPSVTTTYQYDAFGNPTQVVASTSDGYSKTTANTYTNDATNWLLGRLTASTVTSQAPRQLGQYCALPWGGTISNGQSVTAYSAANAPVGQACSAIAQTRTCTNGALSGSYAQQACAAVCALPWGGTISQGQSVMAYSAAGVPSPQVCSSVAETRTCGASGVLSGSNTFQSCAVRQPKRLYLTSGATWTVPTDWNNAINKIEVIGGGGNGGVAYYNSGGGAGGGAYSSISSLALTPGLSVSYNVGLGGTGGYNAPGGNTWFNGTSLSSASVSAQGGQGGGNDSTTCCSVAPAGPGGSASAGIGTVKYSGGNGGGGEFGGGGGGGAAGPSGPGRTGGQAPGGNSWGGSGGGGSNGGSSTNGGPAVVNSPNFGVGGQGTSGSGGATTNCGTGVSGGGGAGGQGASCGGGAGGMDSAFDSSHGSGGGGGGGGASSNNRSATGRPGGPGSTYGGGGGGGGGTNALGGAGGNGIIVITYTPSG
jgi:Salmonella virulence plasmid 65kDa B protein/Insecticide toxin TcdB middle/N-terminal region/FG-GAP-like repeat